MTGPPEAKEQPTVSVPMCIVEILQEVESVGAIEVAAQAERLEPTRDGDEALGFLEPFFQQLVTLWLQKKRAAEEAADSEDFALANKLLTDATFLYGLLDFYVYNSQTMQGEMRGWKVCQGFLLILRNDEEDELEVEFEEDGDLDDDVGKVPQHKPVDRKKLH